MSTAFDRMRRRENAAGKNVRESMIHNTKYFIDTFLPDDPAYKENVEILGKGFINLRMDNYKLVQGTIPQMDIQASLSEKITFRLGDIFFYENGYWLCVDSNNRHDYVRVGKIEECNYFLQWQNPKTLEIIGRWCSIRDPYSSGLDENKVVTYGNARYRIKLPHDEETALFHINKRFLIDIANGEPIPHSIVKYDSVTNRYAARDEGFLVINLKESQIEKDDNWELMIANYKDSPASDIQSVGLCKVTYKGEPIIKSGGSPKTFTAVFFNNGNEEISTVIPTWELVFPPEAQNQNLINILSQNGNEITIGAGNGTKGIKFLLKVSADDSIFGYFENSIEVEVRGII